MDVLRRNTDYALRAILNLAESQEDSVSTRDIADQEKISYQLACKLMQKMKKAGLVESVMGKKGGYSLSRKPADITLKEVIDAIQGPVLLNRCLKKGYVCEKMENCPINKKLKQWQNELDREMQETTLEELIS